MSRSRPAILFVVEHFPPHIGGGETLFGNAARELVQRGHDVEVITTADPGVPLKEMWHGVNVTRMRTSRYAFTIAALPAVIRAARKADLVHTTTYNAAFPAWLGARIARRPCVITVHEVFGPQWTNMPGMNRAAGLGYRIFESATLRLPFDSFIAVSRFTESRLQRLVGIPADRTSVAYPSLDYEFWRPGQHSPRALRDELTLPSDCFIYLYFGRPGLSKGVEYLLAAASTVRRHRPNSRLVMLLSQEPRKQYRKILRLIEESDLGAHVIVLPSQRRQDLPSYLLAADAVVIPSISEGFGYSAVEAATIGCRVIATRGHSVEEVLQGHAEFVEARNSDALAHAISTFGPAAGTPVLPQRYTVAAQVDALEQMYERVLTSA